MNKRKKVYYESRKELQNAGWDVSKEDGIKFNAGGAGETAKHLHAKTATARILKMNDYRIDSEVEHPDRGEVDIIALPTKDTQRPFGVELETSPTQEVVEDKLCRYFRGTPLTEVFIINLNRVPLNILNLKLILIPCS